MAKTSSYQPRTYRYTIKDKDLVSFSVVIRESDLLIRAMTNLKSKAERLVLKYRQPLERYIGQHPDFQTSLEPVAVNSEAPKIVQAMAAATALVGVGPMASVAGAISDFVGKELLAFSPELIIENGGDIFLKTAKKRTVGIYAGDSPLSGKIGLIIEPEATPIAICTSSGTVGHSLSFGMADAAVLLADTATLADAAATAVGNMVKKPDDITRAIEFAQGIEGLRGVVIIIRDKMGIWGKVKLCQM